MAIIAESTYRAPSGFGNAHLQTIYPTLFRRKLRLEYRRERVELQDGDFVDIDFAEVGARRAVVLCHGLEGCSQTKYMLGMAKTFNRVGMDAVCMNYRGCSGEPNRLMKAYHSGATEDLDEVLEYLGKLDRYDALGLVGFSLGGNLILKYLGEGTVHDLVKVGAAISVPCDLGASSRQLDQGFNRIYFYRFLRFLMGKVRIKNELFDAGLDEAVCRKMKNFEAFDGAFTAPLHGFSSAQDYWNKCSSRQFIPAIAHPTLLVNAKDDPFLDDDFCFPFEETRDHPFVQFEVPSVGGHLGFVTFNRINEYWHESRVCSFVTSYLS